MEGIMIKEAAKMLGVEAHVLRYWEDELGLSIKRNSMGHRYYDERDIKMFTEVMALKAKGLTLKDIRTGIEKYRQKAEEKSMEGNDAEEISHENKDTVMQAPKTIHNKEEEKNKEIGGNKETGEDKGDEKVKDGGKNEPDAKRGIKVVDFKLAQMQALMNRVIANALEENKGIITSSIRSEVTEDVMKQMDVIMREREEREEERFRRLDECLRRIQQANDEAAATKMRRRFRKKP